MIKWDDPEVTEWNSSLWTRWGRHPWAPGRIACLSVSRRRHPGEGAVDRTGGASSGRQDSPSGYLQTPGIRQYRRGVARNMAMSSTMSVRQIRLIYSLSGSYTVRRSLSFDLTQNVKVLQWGAAGSQCLDVWVTNSAVSSEEEFAQARKAASEVLETPGAALECGAPAQVQLLQHPDERRQVHRGSALVLHS